MSELGLIVTSLIYLGTAVDQFLRGNPGMGMTFLCYAGANLGLLWAVK